MDANLYNCCCNLYILLCNNDCHSCVLQRTALLSFLHRQKKSIFSNRHHLQQFSQFLLGSWSLSYFLGVTLYFWQAKWKRFCVVTASYESQQRGIKEWAGQEVLPLFYTPLVFDKAYSSDINYSRYSIWEGVYFSCWIGQRADHIQAVSIALAPC